MIFWAENSAWKNIVNFHFPCGQKKKRKTILKENYINNTVNPNIFEVWIYNLVPKVFLFRVVFKTVKIWIFKLLETVKLAPYEDCFQVLKW